MGSEMCIRDSVQSLSEVLGHADVSVKQVIDHRVRPRVDAYEHPEAVKDHVWTQSGGDVFPFSPRSATRDRVQTPHGLCYLVDAGGSRRLSDHEANLILTAPPGVDIYVS